MRKLLSFVLCIGLVAVACTRADAPEIRIGAVYPLSGSQGPGGIDEHRGIMLAADLANQDGGVDGRTIRIESVDTPGSDAAAAAVDQLHAAGIELVLGSYGSTISGPASAEAPGAGTDVGSDASRLWSPTIQNVEPGFTWRESAVSPTISGSVAVA
jgi:hypothetical protein